MPTATIACQSQNQPATFIAAKRIQESLVTAAERRMLRWLALHTPEWINSDHLTLIGFLSQCLVGTCYAWARFNPAMCAVRRWPHRLRRHRREIAFSRLRSLPAIIT